MAQVDIAGAIPAARRANGRVATVAVTSFVFKNPVFVGDLLMLKASLNLVGRTSMEIGVRVEAENLKSGEVRHTASAYLTYVALDDNGRPRTAPELILETEEDRRRNHEARIRREQRLSEKKQEKECQRDPGSCA